MSRKERRLRLLDTLLGVGLVLIPTLSLLAVAGSAFRVRISLLLYGFAAVFGVAGALAARCRRRWIAYAGGAGVLAAYLFIRRAADFDWRWLTDPFKELFTHIGQMYAQVWGDAEASHPPAGCAGALLAIFGALAVLLGAWLLGKKRRPVPALLLTGLLFAGCAGVGDLIGAPAQWGVAWLTAFWITLLFTGRERSGETRSVWLTGLVLPAALLLSAFGVVLCRPAAYTRPAFGRAAEAWIQERFSGGAGDKPAPDTGSDGTDHDSVPAPMTYELTHGGPTDLRGLTPPDQTGKVLFTVSATRAGRMYLRGTVGGVYTGSGFSPVAAYWACTTGIRAEVPEDTSPLLYPSVALEGRLAAEWVTVHPVLLSGDARLIPYYIAPEPVPPEEYHGGDPASENYAGVLDDRGLRYGGVNRDYVLRYYPYEGDGSELSLPAEWQAAEEAYREYAELEYCPFPSEERETRAALADLMAEAGIAKTDGDLIEEIAAYVREAGTYDLTAPPVPEGTDAALCFLTESRRGWCVHFAAAATVLYRAMGVPARYVSGFLVDIAAPDSEQAVTDREAHAWVEIYREGVGWMPVEVTPAAPAGEPFGTTSETSPEKTSSGTTSAGPADQTTAAPRGPAPKQAGRRWVWAASALLMIGGGLFVGLRLRRRGEAGDPGRATVALWRRCQRVGQRLDLPPLPEELTALAERAYYSRDGITSAEGQEARRLAAEWAAAAEQRVSPLKWRRLRRAVKKK